MNARLFIILSAIIVFFAALMPYQGSITAQQTTPQQTTPALGSQTTSFPLQQNEWIEEQMQKLTPDERIGQLFMVAAYSNKDEAHSNEIANLIRQYKIGGLIFFQGTPQRQISMTNYFQAISKVPLLIAIDGEWGLNMRLDNTPNLPHQLTLGAIQDNGLIRDMGQTVANQCKRMGIHINFAPVVDVNVNPNNPVIGDRSFGEDKYNVAQKGVAYMEGMEQNGIVACAKHFPGHGDTDKDSHKALPTIDKSLDELQNIELYPFQQLIARGVSSVMVGHLAVPAIDKTTLPNSKQTIPTTLSKKAVTDMLKKDMGFTGLVFTDALNMKGVSDYYEPGIVDVKALVAGNDVLLFPGNVGNGIAEIKKAIAKGTISQDDIDQRVRKILKAKYRAGLHSFKPIDGNNINADLNNRNVLLLQNRLAEAAVTLARDNYSQIPFKDLDKKRFASLALDAPTLTNFQWILGKYAPFSHHTLKNSDSQANFDRKFETLKTYSHVIVSLHRMNKSSSKNFGVDAKTLTLIKRLQAVTNVSVVVFGSPYALRLFGDLPTVVAAYEDTDPLQSFAAQALFGGISASGKLPITASPAFKVGQGVKTEPPIRLKYTIPEEVGWKMIDLEEGIDKVMTEGIRQQAMPGGVVLIAKDGKVVFEKTYGYQTYTQSQPIQSTDIYDLASVTKITCTVPCLMKLTDLGAFSTGARLKDYLPELANTNKGNLITREILIHEAGLEAWIPFFESTMPANVRADAYRSTPDSLHYIPVAHNMYMSKPYEDMIWQRIAESKLGTPGEYKYSDLGYFYFKKIIEKYANKPLDQYADEQFYKPLGLTTMGYNPYKRFSIYRIPPTENDDQWRLQNVEGYVHDMGAAMLGGVGGHAGLFSDANDLAIMMQMLLNGGYYGGRGYLSQSTINNYTMQQKQGSRRGLGYDKPEPNPAFKASTSTRAPLSVFGHTGFTGTCTWVDPQNKVVYVMLSNRTYPKRSNYKFINNNVRNRVQDVIYEAIERAKWYK
jgi:beta-N-acetylhexosaminidase